MKTNHFVRRCGVQVFRFTGVIAIVSTLVSASGCATAGKAVQPSMPDPRSARTVGEYAHQLSRSVMAPGIAFWDMLIPVPAGPDNQTTEDAVTTFDITWGQKARAFSLQRVRSDFEVMCGLRGGVWSDPYCRGNNDVDRVLFYAVVEPSEGKHPDYDEIGFKTLVIEPKPGHETSPGYIALLRQKTGFRTKDDVAAANSRQRRQEAEARADAARAAAELPEVRTVGSKICQTQGEWVTTGYVEQIVGERIEIRIDNVGFVRNANLHPGSFAGPHIIWDSPNHWHLCR